MKALVLSGLPIDAAAKLAATEVTTAGSAQPPTSSMLRPNARALFTADTANDREAPLTGRFAKTVCRITLDATPRTAATWQAICEFYSVPGAPIRTEFEGHAPYVWFARAVNALRERLPYGDREIIAARLRALRRDRLATMLSPPLPAAIAILVSEIRAQREAIAALEARVKQLERPHEP